MHIAAAGRQSLALQAISLLIKATVALPVLNYLETAVQLNLPSFVVCAVRVPRHRMSCVQRANGNSCSRPRSSSDGNRLQTDHRTKSASLTMSQTRRRRFYIFVHVLLARLEREDVDGLNRAKEVSLVCRYREMIPTMSQYCATACMRVTD